jgi:hypothetical protein
LEERWLNGRRGGSIWRRGGSMGGEVAQWEERWLNLEERY